MQMNTYGLVLKAALAVSTFEVGVLTTLMSVGEHEWEETVIRVGSRLKITLRTDTTKVSVWGREVDDIMNLFQSIDTMPEWVGVRVGASSTAVEGA